MTISCRDHIQDCSIVRAFLLRSSSSSVSLTVAEVEWYATSVCRVPPNLLRHTAFPRSDAAGISSVPDRLKIYVDKIEVIPKRDTNLGNLGRGDRCTKFEVNRTNIK